MADKKLIIDVISRGGILIEGLDDRKKRGLQRGNHIIDYVKNVKDMVKKIIDTCKQNEGKIFHLIISGHGESGVQNVGEIDVIALAQQVKRDENGKFQPNGFKLDKDVEEELNKLNEHFHEDASVTLEGCQTGKGKKGTLLLQYLSALWNGISVQASIAMQYPVWDGLEGTVKRCTIQNCETKSWLFYGLWQKH